MDLGWGRANIQLIGWAKLMEWKYPSVEVVVTSKATFRTAGAVGAAASL